MVYHEPLYLDENAQGTQGSHGYTRSCVADVLQDSPLTSQPPLISERLAASESQGLEEITGLTQNTGA